MSLEDFLLWHFSWPLMHISRSTCNDFKVCLAHQTWRQQADITVLTLYCWVFNDLQQIYRIRFISRNCYFLGKKMDVYFEVVLMHTRNTVLCILRRRSDSRNCNLQQKQISLTVAPSPFKALPSIQNTGQMAGKLTLFKSGNSGPFSYSPTTSTWTSPNPHTNKHTCAHTPSSSPLLLWLTIFPLKITEVACWGGNTLKLERTCEKNQIYILKRGIRW